MSGHSYLAWHLQALARKRVSRIVLPYSLLGDLCWMAAVHERSSPTLAQLADWEEACLAGWIQYCGIPVTFE